MDLVGPLKFSHSDQFFELGRYRYYPELYTLVFREKEILLSRKEGEVLAILATHANQVVPREQIDKQVWEDRGVVVGRSLDTFISKLRKRLQEDQSIRLTNVHGVGYKLEAPVPSK